jgi:D-ribose pyranase
MKKTAVLNSDLSYLIATLGHTDEITICDAGLPIPEEVQRIDLALTHGVPSFIETVRVILSESQIEGVVMADEFKTNSPELHTALLEQLSAEEASCNKKITITYLPHEEFKDRTYYSRAIVRTGECTPYANVIFQAGVVF